MSRIAQRVHARRGSIRPKVSVDIHTVINTLLSDVQTLHSSVFSPLEADFSREIVKIHASREGLDFFTKVLPRLGRALDQALSGVADLNAVECGFTPIPGSKIPLFMGPIFMSVLSVDGRALPTPCVTSIRTLRDVLYLFYKYELPFGPDQEQDTLDLFERTESEVSVFDSLFGRIADYVECNPYRWGDLQPPRTVRIIRNARIKLQRLFRHFDPLDIRPRHGPGAVSTKEQLWGKYTWTQIPSRLTDVYPLDAYFFASPGHVCDSEYSVGCEPFGSILDEEPSARVILVPKDSRGPRLISCEPLAFQWIQQGLGRAIVKHVEHHPLTRDNVHFTDQQPNQFGALLGSMTGKYATLDLKEASDRISVGLVRLLFPEPLRRALIASRSLATVMPDGRSITLSKYAPMGSALCFPVLALTVWALLSSSLPDADAQRVLVYGDDIVVPTEQSENAISILEAFGLSVNRAKSCTKGFFRESCGMDAYKGICVTPVRIRTVWDHHDRAGVFSSWVAYCNSFWERRYYAVYDYIVERLYQRFGPIPSKEQDLSCPSLAHVPENHRPLKRRVNKSLQKLEYLVSVIESRPIHKVISGWKMLLRTFAEAHATDSLDTDLSRCEWAAPLKEPLLFSASEYTRRRSSILVRRWR